MATTAEEMEVAALHRIRSLLMEMPFGAMANFRWTGDSSFRSRIEPTLTDVEVNLTKLRDVLRRVARSDEDTRKRLHDLNTYLAGCAGLVGYVSKLVVDAPTPEP